MVYSFTYNYYTRQLLEIHTAVSKKLKRRRLITNKYHVKQQGRPVISKHCKKNTAANKSYC